MNGIEKAKQYIEDVKSERIVVSKWIKLAIERHERDLLRDDIYLDEEAAQRVFSFFEFCNINIKNRYGKFKPENWQCFLIFSLFGWKNKATGKRRFNYGILWMARKNGKSVLAVLILLYMLVADSEVNPECYLLATTNDQAGITLKYAKSIIKNSPLLQKRLTVNRYRILFKQNDGLMRTLASNAERLDGLNPSAAIIDEYHAHKTTSIFDVIKSGTLFREQPLTLITSTAGFNKDYPFHEYLEVLKRILMGEIDDDSTFCLLYTLDDNDVPEDSDNWIKANPNLNVTVTLDTMLKEYNQSKNTQDGLTNFITKNLNLYVDSKETWISDEDYRECFIDEEIPEGSNCWIGIDLSQTQDLTSLVAVFKVGERFIVKPYFFWPDNEIKKIRKTGINLQSWIDDGEILQGSQKIVDYNLVRDVIYDINSKYTLNSVTYDKYNAQSLMHELMSDGVECNPMQQTAPYFNEPLKFLEGLIFDKKISLSTSKTLRWNFRNVVLYKDPNANIKITKKDSLDSVDGAVALGMAIGGYLKDYNEEIGYVDPIGSWIETFGKGN